MKRISGIAAFFLIISALSLQGANQYLQNGILKVKVDIVGHLSIWTTGGDPTQNYDDNKDVLNNKSFGSSFTVVSVNGNVARFGGSKGKNTMLSERKGNKIITQWKFSGVLFTQEVTFYKGHYSDKNSLVRVKVMVHNKSGKDARVGIRVVLDPMLGPGDDRPFLVPGRGAVTRGVLLKNASDIPSFIYGCDKPVNGNGDFVLNLYGPDLVMPDRVYFAKETYLSSDSVLEPGERSDLGNKFAGNSALAMVWLPRNFRDGATDGIAYAVGTAVHKRREGQPLNILYTLPKKTAREDFWIGIVIGNEDKYWDITNVSVTLRYSGSMARLVKGRPTYRFQILERSGLIFAYWKLKAVKSGRVTPVVDISGTYRSSSLRKSIQATTVLTQ